MTSFQTFETTGTIDENGVLRVEPFAGAPAGQVRVSIKVPTEVLTAMSTPLFNYWTDPAEDVYTREDGRPYEATS